MALVLLDAGMAVSSLTLIVRAGGLQSLRRNFVIWGLSWARSYSWATWGMT
jgi:hypothetical protein